MKFLLRPMPLFLAFTLLLAAPAAAEFTAVEKAQEPHYRNAVFGATSPIWTYMAYVITGITPTTKNAILQAASTTLAAMHELNDGYSALVGDVATDQKLTPGYAVLVASRDARLWVARNRVERLKPGNRGLIPQAVGEWNYAMSLSPDPVYRDYIARIIRPLGGAINELNALDMGLAYLNPKPPVPVKFGTTTIVGPHGDFIEAHWHNWRGRHYTIRAGENLLEALKNAPALPVGAGRPFTNIGLLLESSLRVTSNVSGMAGAPTDAFGGTLTSLDVLTDIMPGLQHSYYVEVMPYKALVGKSPAYDAAVFAADVLLADGWDHFNKSGWQMMIFPGCPPICSVGQRQ